MARTHAPETPTTLLYRSRLIFFPATIITLTDVCSEIYYIMHTTFAGSAGDQVICLTQNKVEKLAVELTHYNIFCRLIFQPFGYENML